MDSFKQISNSR